LDPAVEEMLAAAKAGDVALGVSEEPFSFFGAVFLPSSSSDLGIFYLVWITLFLAIHLIWDWKSTQTPPFHLKRLEAKFGVLFSAASFASSAIIVLSLLSQSVGLLFSDNVLPLVIAGLSGILQSLPALCPYELPPAASKRAESSPNPQPQQTQQ
jgi:hypothetical protein